MTGESSGAIAERYWRRRASAVARRVNAGWWVERLNLLLVIAFTGFAAVLLLLRSLEHPWVEGWQPFAVLGGLVLLAGLAAWWWSRSRYIGAEQGFVRLDDRLGLHNRLSSASSGVIAFPDTEAAAETETAGRKEGAPSWKWASVLVPGLIAAATVLAAWFLPLPDRSADAPPVVNEPEAWEQMEEWLATLEEEELIEPESLEEIEERIEELRNQPEEEWFSHSSLEATDNLKETLGRDIRDLAGDMAAMERDLEALSTYSTEMSEAGREMLLREYEEALKSLAANGLEMNEALAKQLQEIDPSQLGEATMKNLSQAELESLRKQLCEGCKALGSLEGLPALGEGSLLSQRPGLSPGQGGISRGRGDAPLFFGDEDDLGTNNLETVKNEDLSQAGLGDLIGVGETEHEIDEAGTNVRAGGEVSSKGKGGEAVWRDSLLPSEKALLKRYFQ